MQFDPTILPFLLPFLFLLWVIYIYNALVRQAQMVEEAFSGVDVQLKRRADLIPRLVDCVKGYAAHEKALMEGVTSLRTQAQDLKAGKVEERAQVESEIASALSRIVMVAESYPDLKASGNFESLMCELAAVEEDIQLARRYYNGAVRDMNVLVKAFPNILVAGPFHFKTAVFFELSSLAERLPPEVKFAP